MAFGDEHPEQPIGRNNKRITTVLLAAMVAVGGGSAPRRSSSGTLTSRRRSKRQDQSLPPPDTARRTFKTGYAAAPQPEPVKPEPAPAPIQPLTLVQAIAPKPAAPAATAAAAPPKPLLPGFVGQMAPEVPNRTSPAAAPIPSGGQSVDYRPGTSDGRDRLDEDAVQGLSATKNRWLVGAGTQGQDFVTAPFSPPISSTTDPGRHDHSGDHADGDQLRPAGRRRGDDPGAGVRHPDRRADADSTSTRLYGRYADQLAFAQSRAQVAWIRILFPDGSSQNIGAMPGTDASGASGIEGEVDTHPWGWPGRSAGPPCFRSSARPASWCRRPKAAVARPTSASSAPAPRGRATPPRASARK
ncbi:MAG: hypothetical protein IPK66_17585 [Rhodospirillales bacterium]|nr:hypothetical protein [Rhodospirillales bacterium]